jgi:hypothetical protein
MGLAEAREHLDIATKQWERACSDWWEPADPASCVTNVFYAYENLVVATAEAHGLSWEKNHYRKADLAQELYNKKILSRDFRDEILRLNDLRKDVSYGEPGFELADEDLEGLVNELEQVLNEVQSMIAGMEEAAEDE